MHSCRNFFIVISTWTSMYFLFPAPPAPSYFLSVELQYNFSIFCTLGAPCYFSRRPQDLSPRSPRVPFKQWGRPCVGASSTRSPGTPFGSRGGRSTTSGLIELFLRRTCSLDSSRDRFPTPRLHYNHHKINIFIHFPSLNLFLF